jgi:hypothetical protein
VAAAVQLAMAPASLMPSSRICPSLRFAVAQHRADVLGRVALADAAVDAHLLEQVGHAEGARLVGDDGHDAGAELRVLQQVAQHAHEGHRRAHLLVSPTAERTAP